jgi:2-oxoglutarate dehydrogenase E2 component (dihydrolipoamide succinyltransferase)
MFEIKVPGFGESIQEVQVANWLVEVGQWVNKDDELVELESEKASQNLPSDHEGILSEIKVPNGEFASVGDVLCVITPGDKSSGAKPGNAGATSTENSQTSPQPQTAGGAVVAEAVEEASWIMPAAERILSEYKIAADAITPTGPSGRLLKEDVLNYIEAKGLTPAASVTPAASRAAAPAPAPTPAVKPVAAAAARPVAPAPAASAPVAGSDREERAVPMSMIRRTIAKRLVEAQQTAALLTTFNEIDMKPVKDLRGKYKDAFLKKHGVKLGFMSFFAKAVVEGLRRFPAINSEIRGNQVISKNFHDIGVAIGGGKGLVVPILRNVERMSFADVERKIGDYAGLAKDNKIVPADLQGGTFTISNGGVYGSLLSTPIVNPPQSGILGLHTIQERPIALNGEVVIRPMMYVALTYDHRIVDGREAVGFLKTIKEVLEEPARLFLEV